MCISDTDFLLDIHCFLHWLNSGFVEEFWNTSLLAYSFHWVFQYSGLIEEAHVAVEDVVVGDEAVVVVAVVVAVAVAVVG